MPRFFLQTGEIRLMWLEIARHNPALGRWNFDLFPCFCVDDEVSSGQDLERLDGLGVGVVMVHMSFPGDFFLYYFCLVVFDDFVCYRRYDGLFNGGLYSLPWAKAGRK